MPSEDQPITNPDDVEQLKASILDQWRRLPLETGAALIVEQLQDLMARGLISRPESDPAFKPFQVVSVCRADMEECFSPEEIARFDDADMKRLADAMGDAYVDAAFWSDLEVVGKFILDQKDQQQTPDETT